MTAGINPAAVDHRGIGDRVRAGLARVLGNRRLVAGVAVVAVVGGTIAWVAFPEPPRFSARDFMIEIPTGPGGASQARLDATLLLPRAANSEHQVPSILLAHGFGGTKQTVREDAERYANQGYAVLTWSAQGFGHSTGAIHLNSPDWEVSDARHLLDWLAARPEIAKQEPGDPKVGVVGASYGGALALSLAAADERVDAIVPMITWNDLANSFFPESTGGGPKQGVFKRSWAGLFFTAGATGPAQGGASPQGDPSALATDDLGCGRFARDVCEAYLRMASIGRADATGIELLRRASPASIIDRITAPTLLVQGTADSLFPLSEADANARGIAANGTPVKVAWYTGGHDGGDGPESDVERLRNLTTGWLDHYVRGASPAQDTSFSFSRMTGYAVTSQRGLLSSGYTVDEYPGLGGTRGKTVSQTVAGPAQRVVSPPNGEPGALSSLPSAGGLASFVNGLVADIPGQHADFYSKQLATAVDVVGSPTIKIRVASPTGEAVLFAKLYDADSKGVMTLPNGLVSPIRLTGLAAELANASTIAVTLPAIVHRFEAGHRLRVTLATSDQAYATPVQPEVYTVAVEPAVTLPTVTATAISNPDQVWRWVLAGMIVLILAGSIILVLVARHRTRAASRTVVTDQAETPLVVSGLRKEYPGHFVAVETADFAVRRGQVVGLLGPNGAGKTTTLRVLMGLTRPTAGRVLVFGHEVAPGAPVLARVGALVEGPGFLPHLNGIDNLRMYWKATGRPESEAQLPEALEVAGLGKAVYRKVREYSHGMRQRLAIAQAMLGLPELLILDEPTDGLDPPQIAQMRQVLKRYATGGRAVLVSSHLLAEVEQTCTDVVVMHKGRVVAAGGVEEVVGDSPSVALEVSDPEAAREVLAHRPEVRSFESAGNGNLVVELTGSRRSEMVSALVEAGIGVEKVVPRRRLEDAFLSLVGGDTTASGER